jgi:signal transduction histidine kinase
VAFVSHDLRTPLAGIQAHRGTLSAHNLGTGARFEVRLPLATDD